MKRVLVTGSRDWTDEFTIFTALAETLGDFATELRDAGVEDWTDPRHYLLVHGDCPTGADAMAHRIWTEQLHCPVLPRPALWGVWGKKAGPLRNRHMVHDIGADRCLAFIMPGSRGAVDCAKLADKALIPVRRFTP